MKKLAFTILSIVFICASSFAQTRSAIVQKAFKKKFPSAVDVVWTKGASNNWEAEFRVGQVNSTAYFKADGTWLETESEIRVLDLPQMVSDSINAKYPDWVITEAYKIETAENGVRYQAALKKRLGKKGVSYKPDGIAVAN